MLVDEQTGEVLNAAETYSGTIPPGCSWQSQADSADLAVDPRPDLTADRSLWEVAFRRALNSRHWEALQALHLYRCCGARLTQQGGVLKLEPPERFGPDTGWQDQAEWQVDRERILMPVGAALKGILRLPEQRKRA